MTYQNKAFYGFRKMPYLDRSFSAKEPVIRGSFSAKELAI